MTTKVALEESWLFQGLAQEVLARIRSLAQQEEYEIGSTIFSEGDPARHLYILGAGEVELTYTLPCRTPLTMRIAQVSPGEVFGWSALAHGERLTADAVALERSAAYLIPAEPLITVLDGDPVSGYRLMTRLAQLIAKRLRTTRDELRWIQSSI